MDPPSFACGMCGKCFSDAEQCRQHIQMHTGQQPFRCIVCWPLFYDMACKEETPQPSIPSKSVPPSSAASVSSAESSATKMETHKLSATPPLCSSELASRGSAAASVEAEQDSEEKTGAKVVTKGKDIASDVSPNDCVVASPDQDFSVRKSETPNLAENGIAECGDSENCAGQESQADITMKASVGKSQNESATTLTCQEVLENVTPKEFLEDTAQTEYLENPSLDTSQTEYLENPQEKESPCTESSAASSLRKVIAEANEAKDPFDSLQTGDVSSELDPSAPVQQTGMMADKEEACSLSTDQDQETAAEKEISLVAACEEETEAHVHEDNTAGLPQKATDFNLIQEERMVVPPCKESVPVIAGDEIPIRHDGSIKHQQNRPEIRQQDKPDVTEWYKSEARLQDKAEVREQDKPEVTSQNKPKVSVQNKPKVRARDKQGIKVQDKQGVRVWDKPEVNAQSERKVREQVKPKVRGQEKPKVRGQDKPKTRGHNNPEVRVQNKLKVIVQGRRKVRGQDQLMARVQDKPKVRGQNKPRVRGQNKPKARVQSKPKNTFRDGDGGNTVGKHNVTPHALNETQADEILNVADKTSEFTKASDTAAAVMIEFVYPSTSNTCTPNSYVVGKTITSMCNSDTVCDTDLRSENCDADRKQSAAFSLGNQANATWKAGVSGRTNSTSINMSVTDNLTCIQYSFEELITSADFFEHQLMTKELADSEYQKSLSGRVAPKGSHTDGQDKSFLTQRISSVSSVAGLNSSEITQYGKTLSGRRKKGKPKKLTLENPLAPFCAEGLSQEAVTRGYHIPDHVKKGDSEFADNQTFVSTFSETDEKGGHWNGDSGHQCRNLGESDTPSSEVGNLPDSLHSSQRNGVPEFQTPDTTQEAQGKERSEKKGFEIDETKITGTTVSFHGVISFLKNVQLKVSPDAKTEEENNNEPGTCTRPGLETASVADSSPGLTTGPTPGQVDKVGKCAPDNKDNIKINHSTTENTADRMTTTTDGSVSDSVAVEHQHETALSESHEDRSSEWFECIEESGSVTCPDHKHAACSKSLVHSKEPDRERYGFDVSGSSEPGSDIVASTFKDSYCAAEKNCTEPELLTQTCSLRTAAPVEPVSVSQNIPDMKSLTTADQETTDLVFIKSKCKDFSVCLRKLSDNMVENLHAGKTFRVSSGHPYLKDTKQNSRHANTDLAVPRRPCPRKTIETQETEQKENQHSHRGVEGAESQVKWVEDCATNWNADENMQCHNKQDTQVTDRTDFTQQDKPLNVKDQCTEENKQLNSARTSEHSSQNVLDASKKHASKPYEKKSRKSRKCALKMREMWQAKRSLLSAQTLGSSVTGDGNQHTGVSYLCNVPLEFIHQTEPSFAPDVDTNDSQTSKVAGLTTSGGQIKETSAAMSRNDKDSTDSSVTPVRRSSGESIENDLVDLPEIIKPRRKRYKLKSNEYDWKSRLARTWAIVTKSVDDKQADSTAWSEESLPLDLSSRVVPDSRPKDAQPGSLSSPQDHSPSSFINIPAECDQNQARNVRSPPNGEQEQALEQTQRSNEKEQSELAQEKTLNFNHATETGSVSRETLVLTSSPEIFTPSVAESVKRTATRRKSALLASSSTDSSNTFEGGSSDTQIPDAAISFNAKNNFRKRKDILKRARERKKAYHGSEPVRFRRKRNQAVNRTRKKIEIHNNESVSTQPGGVTLGQSSCLSCNQCGAKFRKYVTYLSHRASGCKKRFVCDICGSSMGRKGTLKAHMTVHTGEAAVSCHICGKKLCGRQSLMNHLRIHTGEKPYKCPECPKVFRQSSALTTHSRTHSKERPFSCDTCTKSFRFQKSLYSHRLTHTGERPYACHVCDATFVQVGALNVHLKVHSGERPFACDICFMRFVQKAHLEKHMRHIHLHKVHEVEYKKVTEEEAKQHTCTLFH
ncbi:uncharacterized protein LOC143282137 isoform X2 [Babylonia areolata]